MKKVLAISLLLASCATQADWAAPLRGTDFILATEQACPTALSEKYIKADYRDRFHRATAHIEGETFEGCWASENGLVYLIWEDGSVGTLPVAKFQKLKEV